MPIQLAPLAVGKKGPEDCVAIEDPNLDAEDHAEPERARRPTHVAGRDEAAHCEMVPCAARTLRVGYGFCAMPLTLVLVNNAVKLNRIPWLNVRAVVRRFLGDRNVMRMVLPHRRSRDADESCIASQLFNRP